MAGYTAATYGAPTGPAVVLKIKGAAEFSNLPRASVWHPSPNPYVVVAIAGRGEVTRTSVIKNSITPKWNHSAVLTGVTPASVLIISLMDHHLVSADVVLGTGKVSLLRGAHVATGPMTVEVSTTGGARVALVHIQVEPNAEFLKCEVPEDEVLAATQAADEEAAAVAAGGLRSRTQGSVGRRGTVTASKEKQEDDAWFIADVLKEAYGEVGGWSLSDLTLGMYYLKRAEVANRLKDAEKNGELIARTEVKDLQWVQEQLYWFNLIEGSYKKTNEELFQYTGIKEDDLLYSDWVSTNLKPGFYVVAIPDRSTIAVVVRGTASVRDAATDLACAKDDFLGGKCHRGMLCAANEVLKIIRPILEVALKSKPGYTVKFLGHSLGGSTAALLAMLFNRSSTAARVAASPASPGATTLTPEYVDDFPELPVVASALVMAPGACVSLNVAQECKDYVTAFVLGDDIIPRLSTAGLDELRDRIASFDWASELVGDAKETRLVKMSQQLGTQLSDATSHWTGALGSWWTKKVESDTGKGKEFSGKVADLTEDEISDLRDIFFGFDTDNDGHITVEEVQQAMSISGHALTDAQLAAMIHHADEDGSGGVDFPEFLEVAAQSAKTASQHSAQPASSGDPKTAPTDSLHVDVNAPPADVDPKDSRLAPSVPRTPNAEKLFCPGRCFHFVYHEKDWHVREVPNDDMGRIILSDFMLANHKSLGYIAALQRIEDRLKAACADA